MARTRANDFDDKLQLILDTAADLFAGRGFSAATTTDIAVACRMSKSALYHYHKSKESILYALLITHLAQVIQQVQHAVGAVSDPRERLLAFVTALLASNSVSRSKNIVLLNETWALPPAQQAEIKRLEKKLVQIGMDLLKPLNPEIMERTALRQPYSMFLFGLVNWTYTWYDPKGSIGPAELAERLTGVFLNGFPNVTASLESKNVVRLRRGREPKEAQG